MLDLSSLPDRRNITYSCGCLYILLIYCFYRHTCLCNNFNGLSALVGCWSSAFIRMIIYNRSISLCRVEPVVQFPEKGIILASLLVFPILGCRHSLLRHCNSSRFSQVECTFSKIPSCVHLPVVDITPCAFGVNRQVYIVVLQRHLLFVDHFKRIKYLTFPLR